MFQAFNLIPTFTAKENFTLPLDIAGADVDVEWFDTVVDTVGIARSAGPSPLGALGRSAAASRGGAPSVSRPDIVFADEPTGNLDSKSGSELLAFLRTAVDDHGQTIVMVTHDAHAAAHADRIVFLADGRIVDELREPTAERILDRLKAMEA